MKISIRNVSGLVFLFLSVLLCCLRANAASTNIIGTLRGPDHSAFYGSVVFQLPVPVQNTSDSTSICPCAVQYRINNGIVSTYNSLAPTLLDNDNMQPAGTFYIASFYDVSGNFKWQANYVIPAGPTWDIGQAVPTSVTTTNISYINPMTTNTAQNITGTKTFTVPWISTVATGTAPFQVASQTKVANLKVASLTSDTANPATSIQPIQLANTDKVCWRRASNTSDVCLKVSATSSDPNQFIAEEFGGSTINPLSKGFLTRGLAETVTISNSLVETLFTSTPDVLSTSQGTAQTFMVRVSGNITNTSGGAVNYTFRLRQNSSGGTLLASTATISVATATTGAPFDMEVWFTCVANCTIASATWDISGHYWINTSSGAITSNGTITMDPTSGITMIGTCQMGTAAATASCTGRTHEIVRVL